MQAAAAAQPARPDVVVVLAQGTREVPARLAAEGMVFERAYSASPSVEGSHAALVAGRFPHAVSKETLARPFFAFHSLPPETDSNAVAEKLLDSAKIFVFTSGFGAEVDSPLEASARVPLAVRYPGVVKPGTKFDGLVSTVDILPSLLEWCGLAAPGDLHGRSFASGGRAESIFSEGNLGHFNEWRMMVRGFDKIAINMAGDVTHLYNLAEDPEEKHNEADARDNRLRKDELLALLEAWRRKTSDGRTGSGLKRRRD